ncbi:MAG: DUF6263 family protein [Planctomycetota bacterium]
MRTNTMIKQASVLAVAAAFFTATADVSAESVMLKPKHKVGETVYVEQSAEIVQLIHNPMMGEPMEIAIHRIYGLLRKTDSGSSDGAKMSWTFDRTMQKVDSPMMEAAYDSDAPGAEDESELIAGPLNAMIGGKFNVEIDKDNTATSCSGMKAILDKAMEDAPGNPFSQQLQRELTDDRGRVNYGESMYLMYPNKEVNVGDTWKKTQRDLLPQIGKVVSRYEYKLDKITEEAGRKVAVISFKSTMEKDTSGKPADDVGPLGNADVKGTSSGTTTFDIERGMVTKSIANNETKIETKAKASDAKDGDEEEDGAQHSPPPGMKIEVKVKQTTLLMNEADRAKQKEAAAKHAKEVKKAEPKKETKKPAKKSDADEDEDE